MKIDVETEKTQRFRVKAPFYQFVVFRAWFGSAASRVSPARFGDLMGCGQRELHRQHVAEPAVTVGLLNDVRLASEALHQNPASRHI
ncbi:MAG: hypothetical protein ABSA66_08360 [Roseiarcus sp.]|jgi:hypothetical protein